MLVFLVLDLVLPILVLLVLVVVLVVVVGGGGVLLPLCLSLKFCLSETFS